MKAPSPGFVVELNGNEGSSRPGVIVLPTGCVSSIKPRCCHSPEPMRYFTNTQAASQLFRGDETRQEFKLSGISEDI